jgi:predicted dehydrogenase/D-arabinose 1-dehydrogenase-like Zn-dependent alcohol dehydrogenase
MRQILQNLKNGVTEVAEVPAPCVGAGELLIRTTHTLISAGTERMLVEFGRANLIDKARQQPDKVRQVLDKVRTDGLLETLDTVRSKLDQPVALGYCNVGVAVELGCGVEGFAVGDRVVSNGKHAEVVCVPKNLCARIPDAVPDDHAAFTVLAAVGLQGIRLANPTLGECVVVTGLGLIGLLTVQLLRAQGCQVLGIDLDSTRLGMAAQFGAKTVDLSLGEDPLSVAAAFSRGRGVDAVIITAATKSNEPVRQAARMCRQRGRIVLVGVSGLELSRADFYEKELSFQVSCSYGPGRYDPAYEEGGHDYPVGFVRWTEQRNLEAVLDLMANGSLNVAPLITHRFSIEQAQRAYDVITERESAMGIILQYPQDEGLGSRTPKRTIALKSPIAERAAALPHAGSAVRIGVIGSGNYGTQVLLPAFKAAGVQVVTVASRSGITGLHAARKFDAEETTTDVATVLARNDIDAVVIATRHDSHARYVCQALAAGKSVFVEKPLVIGSAELAAVTAAHERAVSQYPTLTLMVGFNRRFAPHIVKARQLLSSVAEPKCMVMTVNAGAIPLNHWTQDREAGGGRLIGEGCHFVDLLRFLVGVPIADYEVRSIGKPVGGTSSDKFTLTLSFRDGSIGTLHYFANGHRSFSKERLEIYCANRVLQLENFRRMTAFGWSGFRTMNLWRQDKGQRACTEAFVNAVRHGTSSPISFEELVEVSRVCIEAARSLG